MGICLSCLRDEGEEEPQEQSPLLQQQDSHPSYMTGSVTTIREEPSVDRVKRDQTLRDIVEFTGENFIDVTSVAQPEVRTVGKSAADYKRALAELKAFSNSQNAPASSSPPSMTFSPSSDCVLPKASEEELSEQDQQWLKSLGQGITKALSQEPVVHSVGDLVLDFNQLDD